MKYLLAPLLVLSVGTAAVAATPGTDAASASYPPCSKSVKDQCTETAAPHAKAGAGHGHKAAHHRHRHATAAKSG